MRFIGIDVSKQDLHTAVHGDEQWGVRHSRNNEDGRRGLCADIAEFAPCRVVVEATGKYHRAITSEIAALDGVEVMVANPRATRNFAKSVLRRGKSDKLDARDIARFAATADFRPWKSPPPSADKLRKLMRRRAQLVAFLAKERTRLREALAVKDDPFVITDLKASIHQTQERIKRLERAASQVIRSCAVLKQWKAQLTTIPGVADVTAMLLLAELGPLPEDMTAKQLVAYAGLDPAPWQSGMMDAKRRISRQGNKRLRTVLFLAAWNARRSPQVAEWHQRLVARGKPPKLATVAVSRRLLHAIHGMRRSGSDWNGARFLPPQEDPHVA